MPCLHPSLRRSDEASPWTGVVDPFGDIAHLIDSELDHSPSADYLRRLRDRSLDPTARQDAVFWILKVSNHHGFRPPTASLAVTLLDRFLSRSHLPLRDGWPLQLLAVACVSVAAKMEEIDVPLLPDLQTMDPRFAFEPRTVQRMELLLMSALRWRLRSITPFDYLDRLLPIASRDDSSSGSASQLCSRVSSLIVGTHRVMDFLEFRPSAICAAAIICATDNHHVSPAFPSQLDTGAVGRCRQLMDSYLVDTCPGSKRLDRVAVEPSSPIGVLDAAACPSCVAASEPAAKRRRLELECTERIDEEDTLEADNSDPPSNNYS